MVRTQTEIADRIVAALDGHHTAAGTYGHSLLSARTWAKNGRCRVYLDRRHVGTNGTINSRVEGFGYIEILPGGELMFAVRNDANEITQLVAGLAPARNPRNPSSY